MRKIKLSRNSEKTLRKLEISDKATYQAILNKITRLEEDPFLHGVKKLVGYDGFYRIRIDKYRVIYRLDMENIYIMHIAKREDVYDFLLKI